MKKLFLLGLFIILITGCHSYNPDGHLEEKYHETFQYVGIIDSESDWIEYHYKNSNQVDLIVTCNDNGCRDNYYKVMKEKEIVEYAKGELAKIDELKEYKFYVSNNLGYCDNEITLETTIPDALKIDSRCDIASPIEVYVLKSVDIPQNNEVLENFDKNNIVFHIYKVDEEDYQLLSVDQDNYIYDYIVTTDISVGINSKYAFIKKTKLY